MKDGTFPTDSVLSCASGASVYVQTYVPDALYTDADFGAFIAMAKLMVQAGSLDPASLVGITGHEVSQHIGSKFRTDYFRPESLFVFGTFYCSQPSIWAGQIVHLYCGAPYPDSPKPTIELFKICYHLHRT